MCIVCEVRKSYKKDYQLLFGKIDDPQSGAALGPPIDIARDGNTATLINSSTGDQNIDALLAPRRYLPTQLTFSFPQSTSAYEANYGSTAESARTALLTFSPATSLMQTAARYVFALASSLTGLTITETVGPSNFRLGLFTPAADGTGKQTAFAFLPSSSNVGGDSWFSNTTSFISPQRGNYAWITMLHELGHNLGLEHGHESDGVAGVAMTSDRDSMEFSVMTYRPYIGGPVTGYRNERWGFAQTYMMYDIAALQHMYGADFATNAGDTVYTVSPISGEIFVNGVGQGAPGGNRVFATLWDGGGNDTYNFSSYGAGMDIDLRAGSWSKLSTTQLANLGDGNFARANIFNALMFRGNTVSLIENSIGGDGADNMIGNQAQNRLDGRAGNDTINGGSGADTLQGEEGDDILFGDFFAKTTVDPGPGVGSSGSASQALALGAAPTSQETALNLTNNFSLSANSDIQNSTTELHTTITALGNGGAHWYAITLTGANVRMTIDIDYTTGGLDSFVRLATTAPGPPLPQTSNILFLAENDDADVNAGGTGSAVAQDSYLSYTLRTPGTYYVIVGTYEAIDSLATGTGYSVHISVATVAPTTMEGDGGTAGNDVLSGGNGNDVLDGGLGADVLDGGAGFDFASYANSTSGLTLFMGGGTFNSGEAFGDIHNSIEGLIGSQFSDIIGGDAGLNELRGLNGNDFIYGRGGIDTLLGGDGNDVLSGGLEADRLEGGNGIDVAFYREATTGITASLLSGGGTGEAAGDTYLNIENIWGSNFNDVLAGDNNAGQVYGFDGDDNLSGLGGDDFFYGGVGADTIVGGDGVDSSFFLSWNDHLNQFGTPEPYEGGDVFTDFVSGTDRIILSRFWFGFGNIAGPAAALTEANANFVTNGTVATSRPSLIWNNNARTLSFDADGVGANQAVLLGTFQGGGQLALGDIWTA
jgi:serralysin